MDQKEKKYLYTPKEIDDIVKEFETTSLDFDKFERELALNFRKKISGAVKDIYKSGFNIIESGMGLEVPEEIVKKYENFISPKKISNKNLKSKKINPNNIPIGKISLPDMNYYQDIVDAIGDKYIQIYETSDFRDSAETFNEYMDFSSLEKIINTSKYVASMAKKRSNNPIYKNINDIFNQLLPILQHPNSIKADIMSLYQNYDKANTISSTASIRERKEEQGRSWKADEVVDIFGGSISGQKVGVSDLSKYLTPNFAQKLITQVLGGEKSNAVIQTVKEQISNIVNTMSLDDIQSELSTTLGVSKEHIQSQADVFNIVKDILLQNVVAKKGQYGAQNESFISSLEKNIETIIPNTDKTGYFATLNLQKIMSNIRNAEVLKSDMTMLSEKSGIDITKIITGFLQDSHISGQSIENMMVDYQKIMPILEKSGVLDVKKFDTEDAFKKFEIFKTLLKSLPNRVYSHLGQDLDSIDTESFYRALQFDTNPQKNITNVMGKNNEWFYTSYEEYTQRLNNIISTLQNDRKNSLINHEGMSPEDYDKYLTALNNENYKGNINDLKLEYQQKYSNYIETMIDYYTKSLIEFENSKKQYYVNKKKENGESLSGITKFTASSEGSLFGTSNFETKDGNVGIGRSIMFDGQPEWLNSIGQEYDIATEERRQQIIQQLREIYNSGSKKEREWLLQKLKENQKKDIDNRQQNVDFNAFSGSDILTTDFLNTLTPKDLNNSKIDVDKYKIAKTNQQLELDLSDLNYKEIEKIYAKATESQKRRIEKTKAYQKLFSKEAIAQREAAIDHAQNVYNSFVDDEVLEQGMTENVVGNDKKSVFISNFSKQYAKGGQTYSGVGVVFDNEAMFVKDIVSQYATATEERRQQIIQQLREIYNSGTIKQQEWLIAELNRLATNDGKATMEGLNNSYNSSALLMKDFEQGMADEYQSRKISALNNLIWDNNNHKFVRKKNNDIVITNTDNENLNIVENTVEQTPIVPTQTALGAEQEALGNFGPAVQSHVEEIGKAIQIEKDKIAVSQALVTQLGVEKEALQETLGLAGQTGRIGENAGIVTGTHSQNAMGDMIVNNQGENNILSSKEGTEFFDYYNNLNTAKIMLEQSGEKFFTNAVKMKKLGTKSWLDKDHKYHYLDETGTEQILEDVITASEFFYKSQIGNNSWKDTPDQKLRKMYAEKLLKSDKGVDIVHEDEYGNIITSTAKNFDDLNLFTGQNFSSIAKTMSSTIIGNVTHKILELTSNNKVDNINQLTGNDKEEWNKFFNDQNNQFKKIYDDRKNLFEISQKKAIGIKTLKDLVLTELGIDQNSKALKTLNETALVGQYYDETTGAMQNVAGTFDTLISDMVLGDYKTTNKIKFGPLGAQFQLLTDLLTTNAEEIFGKDVNISKIQEKLKSVVLQSGKDGTLRAMGIPNLTSQQIADMLTGIHYNQMMSKLYPDVQENTEALGAIYAYRRPMSFSEKNLNIYKEFEALKSDEATRDDFIKKAEELGLKRISSSIVGNDESYTWEGIDEATGKILQIGAKFNSSGGILPSGDAISYREKDAKEANTQKGKYVDLLRQELEYSEQIKTLQTQIASAKIQGKPIETLTQSISILQEYLNLLKLQKEDINLDNKENIENEFKNSLTAKEIVGKEKSKRTKSAEEVFTTKETQYYNLLKEELKVGNALKILDKKLALSDDMFEQNALSIEAEHLRDVLRKIVNEINNFDFSIKDKNRIYDDFYKKEGIEINNKYNIDDAMLDNSNVQNINTLLGKREQLLNNIVKISAKSTHSPVDIESLEKAYISLQKIEAKIKNIINLKDSNGQFLLSDDMRKVLSNYVSEQTNIQDETYQKSVENQIETNENNINKKTYKNELEEQENLKQQKLSQKLQLLEEKRKYLPLSDAYQNVQNEINNLDNEIQTLSKLRYDFTNKTISKIDNDGKWQTIATLSNEEAVAFEKTYGKSLAKTQHLYDDIMKSSQKKGFFGSIKDSVNSTLQYMMVWQAGYMIIGKVRQAIQTVINTTKELDKTMTNLQIVTGKTKEETYEMMKNYSSLAQELGGTIGEVSASANEWLRMGYSTAEVNTLITDTMMLSKLGMIDTTKATEYLTSAIKGYGVAVKDASEIVDMATALDMKYAVSSGYILEAMSKTAASAKLAKVEMSDLQSMIAVAGEVTQKDASVIGESFKTAFARYGNVKANAFVGNSDLIGLKDTYAYESNLSENSEDMSKVNDIEKVLNKVNIDLREKDMVTWRSYTDILKDIGEGWKTYSDYEKNAITTALFGTRQRENGLVVLENYSRVLQAQEVAISSVGTASKKYEAYQNSLESSTKKVSAALEDLILKLEAGGILKDLSDSIVWLIKNLKIVAPLMLTAFAIGHLDSFILKLNKISYFINSKMLALGKLDFRGLFSGTANKISMGIDSSRNYFETEQLKGLETKKQLTTAQLMTIEFEKMYNILKGMSYEEAEQLAVERRKTLESNKQLGHETSQTENDAAQASSETSQTVNDEAQLQFEFMQTENDIAQNVSETSQTAQDQIQSFLEGNSTTQEFLQLKGEEGQTVQDFLQLKAEEGQTLEDLKQLNSERLQSIQDQLQLSDEQMQTLLKSKFGKNQTFGNLLLQSQGKLTPLNSFIKGSGYLMGGIGGWSLGGQAADAMGVENPVGRFAVKGLGAGVGLLATKGASVGVAKLGGAIAGKFAGTKIGGAIGTALGGPLGSAIGVIIGGAVTLGISKFIENRNKKKQEELKIIRDELANLEEHYSKASSADTATNIERYDELAQGVNNLGQNVSLTNSEYEEFLNLGNELAQTFPELVTGTDRFGNSLLGVDDKIGGLREQVSNLLTDLQKDVDAKLLNPDLAKEEFKNAKNNVEDVPKKISTAANIDYYDVLQALSGDEKKSVVLNASNLRDLGIDNDVLKEAGIYGYNIEGNVFSQLFDANPDISKDIISYSELDDIAKEKLKKYATAQINTLKGQENVASNEFTSQYLPAIMRESWDYSTLDENLQEFSNRMAQGLDISEFKNFDEYKKFIEEKIVKPLKDSKGEISPILEDIYAFDFEGSNNTAFEDNETFNRQISSIVDFYKKNTSEYESLKTNLGITTDNGKMYNKFGVEVTDEDIITDFLGIENSANSVITKIEEKIGKNDLSKTLSDKFKTSELKAIADFSSDKLLNIAGSGDLNQQIKNIEEYLKDNNIISMQSMVSALTNSIQKDIKEGRNGAKELEEFLENEAWNINPEDFDINQFGNISEETKKQIEDLINRAENLNVTIGEAYNNVKELLSLNKYNETSLSVSQINSRYEELSKIAKEMRENGSISSESADKIAESFPDLFADIGDSETFIDNVQKMLSNKTDLIKGSIKEDLSNNEAYFKKLAEAYKLDYETYKTYAQLRSDIDKYGDLYNYNTGLIDVDKLKNRLKNDFIEEGNTWNDKTEYNHYISQLGIQQQSGETPEEAFGRWVRAFNKGIPVSFDINTNIEEESEIIAQKITDQSIKDVNKAYKDLMKTERDYRKKVRDLNRQARDQRNKESLQSITDMLERRNIIIEEYNNKIKAIEVGQSFLDTMDFGGSYNLLNDKYDLTSSKLSNLQSKFLDLSSTIPKSSEEASKLASEMQSVASEIMDAEQSLFNFEKEMKSMGLEAFSKNLENINTQYEREQKLLDNMSTILQNDNGIVSAWDLVDFNAFGTVKKETIVDEREQANQLLKEQISLQKQVNDMQLKHLDLLKEENEEENNIFWLDHEQELLDAQETLYEAQTDFWDKYGTFLTEQGYTMDQFVSTEAQRWQTLGNLIDSVKQKMSTLGSNDINSEESSLDMSTAAVRNRAGIKAGGLVSAGENFEKYVSNTKIETGASEADIYSQLVNSHGTEEQKKLFNETDHLETQKGIAAEVISRIADDFNTEQKNNGGREQLIKPSQYRVVIPIGEGIVLPDSVRDNLFKKINKLGVDTIDPKTGILGLAKQQKNGKPIDFKEIETTINNYMRDYFKNVDPYTNENSKTYALDSMFGQKTKDLFTAINGSREANNISGFKKTEKLDTLYFNTKEQRDQFKQKYSSASFVTMYADGTSNLGHKGGPALVGEGEYKELVILPDGESFIVSDATLMPDMPRGTQVVPLKGYSEGTMNLSDFSDNLVTKNILKNYINSDELLTKNILECMSDSYIDSDKLSKSILSQEEEAVETAQEEISRDYKKNVDLQLKSPELNNSSFIGTEEKSLQSRIIKKIKDVYKKIGEEDYLGILTVAPAVDGESWSKFGEEIAKYISEGIDRAIEADLSVDENDIAIDVNGAYSETSGSSTNIQNNLKKGQTVYFRTGSKEGHVGIYDGNGMVYHLAGPKGKSSVLHQSFDYLANKYEFLGAGWNGGLELTSSQADDVIELASTFNTFGRKNGECQAWIADLVSKGTGTRRISYDNPEAIVRDKKDWLTEIPQTSTVTFTEKTLFTKLLEHNFKDYMKNEEFELPEDYTGSMFDNAKVIWGYLLNKGYNSKAIAAIIGNFVQESGLNPYAVNSIGATGLAQWLGGRKKTLIERYG